MVMERSVRHLVDVTAPCGALSFLTEPFWTERFQPLVDVFLEQFLQVVCPDCGPEVVPGHENDGY